MMLSYALCLFLLLEIFPTAAPAYTATDLILLNCGTSLSLKDTSRRSWDSDDISRYSASKASNMHPSVHKVPFETVTFSPSPIARSFPLLPGSKFLRLYFHLTNYTHFDPSQSFFSVTANASTLLSNFSAFLYSKSTSQLSFMKEFIVNIAENQRLLNVTFSPSPNSFAFVNGIEIVSIPDKLYFTGNDVPIKFVDQLFYLNNNNTAMENLYRLSVGGSRVEIQDDSGTTRGMFRAWNPDDEYIYSANLGWTPHAVKLPIKYTAETPPYSAPETVYRTSRVLGNSSKSLDWLFPVDSGFHYLLRLHFCEIQLEVTRENERVFTININNQTVEAQSDVIFWTGSTGTPIFKDYITWVPDDGRRGKQDLWLSLFPNMEGLPRYSSAFLNGLEIFKLSNSSQSLAAANPELVKDYFPPLAAAMKPIGKTKSRKFSVIFVVIGILIGVLAVVAAMSFLIYQRQKVKHLANKKTRGSGVSLPPDLCRYFSLDEIKTATRKFDDNLVIGRGGFGNVYKGLIGPTTMAIKRLNPSSTQGAREFLTEIEMLTKLRHLHLVSLIGYCDENGEMILVYEYMAHGTLRSRLYNSENPPLTWKQRLQICTGAAKGLDYLHTGTKHAIIHRDVKSTNILLDEKWVAKVSDFGLSKVGPSGEAKTHVSTVVKGSLGYVDPDYCRRQRLTEKSDVYSFGVVLFEVLCARPPIIPSLAREQVNLAEWASFCFKEGTTEHIIDSKLKGQIAPECLSKFAETAVACLSDKGNDRPAMNDVVWSLECAMQLQDAADSDGDSFIGLNELFELQTLEHA